MLTIRLFRVGKKNQPAFKIVVTDKRKPPRAGRYVEEVGFYNPLTKEKVLKPERIKYWLSVGAKASYTVHNLLVKEKIIGDKKIPMHKKSEKPAEAQKEEAPKIELQKEEGQKTEAPETQVKPEGQTPEPRPANEEKPTAAEPLKEETIAPEKKTNQEEK